MAAEDYGEEKKEETEFNVSSTKGVENIKAREWIRKSCSQICPYLNQKGPGKHRVQHCILLSLQVNVFCIFYLRCSSFLKLPHSGSVESTLRDMFTQPETLPVSRVTGSVPWRGLRRWMPTRALPSNGTDCRRFYSCISNGSNMIMKRAKQARSTIAVLFHW